MQTTAGSQSSYQQATISHARSNQAARPTSYDRWIQKLNFSYFGIISMTILIGSIIGGISAMYILQYNAPIWQLGLCMSAAMANNVAAIGQASTKWVVNLFLICVVVNTVLILVNAL